MTGLANCGTTSIKLIPPTHSPLFFMKRLLSLLLVIATLPCVAQQNSIFIDYIETYKEMAIDQMQRHNVPASITLAQGILESAAGKSFLATTANNHFGIKIGTSWTGPWVTKDDDAKQEKFRKYNTPEESFEDHSLFLHKARYAALFELPLTDYRSWAHGLKAAGYATNPQYPQLLIKLIEDYNLAQYDAAPVAAANTNTETDDKGFTDFVETPQYTAIHQPLYAHKPRINNEVAYILANDGDTYESVAREFGINPDKLRTFNEVDVHHIPHQNEIVYLAAKKKHAGVGCRGKYHRVQAGESIHSISQMYGVKYKCIYKWNRMPTYYIPTPGDLILLK